MFQNMIRVPKKFEQMLIDIGNQEEEQMKRFEAWCREHLALKDADFKREPDGDDFRRYKFLYVRQLLVLWRYMESKVPEQNASRQHQPRIDL